MLVVAAAALGAVGWRSWTVRDLWYRLTGAYGEPGDAAALYPVTYKSGHAALEVPAEPAVYDIGLPRPRVGRRRGDPGRYPGPDLSARPDREPSALLEGGLHFGDYVADGS